MAIETSGSLYTSGSISVNPSIVTEGLLFYFDAANPRSYTGVTSSWTDLTTTNFTSSFINSPVSVTYTSSFGGGFNFPSSSNTTVPRLSIPYTLPDSSSFAVDLWFTQTQLNSIYIRGIFSCGEFWNSTTPSSSLHPGWGFGYGGDNVTILAHVCEFPSNTRTTITGPVSTPNTPYHLFLHRNTNTQTLVFYVNGRLIQSVAFANTKTLGTFTKTIQHTVWEAGPARAPLGIFHAVKVYHNKNFTAGEIRQNYDALKGRFGLI